MVIVKHRITNLLGPVHTNPFSNENGAVLLRIRRLSSTLQRRKRSPKTELFENALQSGAIWKRCFLKTLFSSVNGENDAIWKRWRHQNKHFQAPNHSTVEYPKWRTHATMWLHFRANFAGRYIEMRMRRDHLTMRTVGITAFSNRYGVVVWTGENDTKTTSVDANLFENEAKQPRFRLKTDKCGQGLIQLANSCDCCK